MRAKLIILSLALLFGYKAVAQQIETIGEFTFIRYEPIQMHATDSIMIHFREYHWGEIGRWGEFAGIRSEKIAVRNLAAGRVHYTLSYLMALEPTFLIWQEALSHRYEERRNIRCIRVDFNPYSGDFCVIFRAIIESDTITINTPEKFRELFAPVENAQQAVAFAHIFTGAVLKYHFEHLKRKIRDEIWRARLEEIKANQQEQLENDKVQNIVPQEDTIRIIPPPPPPPLPPLLPPRIEIHQTEIISSNVERTDDGFKVWLYCRSTPHYEWVRFSLTYTRKLIMVTFDGKVEILESIPVYSWLRSNLMY